LIKDRPSFVLSEIFPRKTRDLHETRTSLVKAETSKTHLEQRVEELSRKQQGDAERLAVYERRPSAINGATHHVGADSGSREQQLEAEVADLRYVAHLAVLCVTHSCPMLVRRLRWPRLTWLLPVIIYNNSRRSARPVRRRWRH
jgi:hypothetical protein